MSTAETTPARGDLTDSPSLKGFDAHARRIVRDALADGWLARRSAKGHILLYAPDGVTTAAVSRHMSVPRVRENTERPIRAWRQRQADIDPAAPAGPARVADAAVDQPAPVVERRLAHLRRTAT
ncbi:Uncharacterised protein [Mycobacteroides abscessus subsp. abscessus]|nr:Uncharacterised protein [Mycobacteroides abscessus subsp. abscessus]